MIVVGAVVLLAPASASANYPHRIPQGYTNPAGPSGGRCYICHVAAGGGGTRTAFGEAFIANGRVWNANLAELDSDGDGWTNGQELGDPFGDWDEGESYVSSYRGNPGRGTNTGSIPEAEVPSNFNLCAVSAYNDCATTGGTCSDFSAGRWSCGCASGYSGSGVGGGHRRTESHVWSGGAGTRRYNVRSTRAGCFDIDECVGNPCGSGRGNCSETAPPGYTCSCFSGYVFNGSTCVNENECVTTPGICGPGTCSDESPGYDCDCDPGFGFNGTTCVTENACLAGLHDCHREATCTPVGDSSWNCTCNEGWSGVGDRFRGTGDRCVDINECMTMPGLCGVGACRNSAGGYTCTCPSGYSFNGTTCVDVNECAGRNPCGVGSCRNDPGSYTCSCPAGYEFAGGTCADIDECEVDPCGVGTCSQTDPPGYRCSCPVGYVTNGSTCVDLDECASPDLSLCDDAPIGECINEEGSFTCTCAAGYRGDSEGRNCMDVNECADGTHDCAPPGTGGRCENTEGGFTCSCQDGFEGTGVTCRDIDECADGTLRCEGSGETCQNNVGMPAECVCRPGFLRTEGGDCVRACGDGRRTAGEECDDGNTDDGDGCSSVCEIEVPFSCWENDAGLSTCENTCGDGLVQPNEECDVPERSDTEPDMCRTNCLFAHCGDGVLDSGETCDDGDANSDETPGACRSTCVPAFCGDGVVDEGESCDDGTGDCSCADAGVDGGDGPMGGGGCSAPGGGSGAALGLFLLLWRRRRRA